jgi:hypothetical protein
MLFFCFSAKNTPLFHLIEWRHLRSLSVNRENSILILKEILPETHKTEAEMLFKDD